MKPGNIKRKAWERTAKIMQKYGDGTPFRLPDLEAMGMTRSIARSQIHMFQRRGMLKTVSIVGKVATYKLTRKTFRNERSRRSSDAGKYGKIHVGNTPTPGVFAVVKSDDIHVAITGNKLMVDAPGLIFELVGKIHLKLDT